MMGSYFPAYLSPSFPERCEGKVHSAFNRVVNISFHAGEDLDLRLLALVAPQVPRIPDSVCIPFDILRKLKPGMVARWQPGCLQIDTLSLPVQCESRWNGRITHRSTPPTQKKSFLEMTSSLPSGLDRLPTHLRVPAISALTGATAAHWLGLGPGLTPAYDDACIGVMALLHAMGKRLRFLIKPQANTTDVSLRYLLLAQEGFFGELILTVIDALWNKGDLAQAVQALSSVGATSGYDILLGMRTLLNDESDHFVTN